MSFVEKLRKAKIKHELKKSQKTAVKARRAEAAALRAERQAKEENRLEAARMRISKVRGTGKGSKTLKRIGKGATKAAKAAPKFVSGMQDWADSFSGAPRKKPTKRRKKKASQPQYIIVQQAPKKRKKRRRKPKMDIFGY